MAYILNNYSIHCSSMPVNKTQKSRKNVKVNRCQLVFIYYDDIILLKRILERILTNIENSGEKWNNITQSETLLKNEQDENY